jgi:DNA polymerase
MTETDRPPRPLVDFEARSRVSLKDSGAGLYCRDPSTEPLCMAYSLPGGDPGRQVYLWYPEWLAELHGLPDPRQTQDVEWAGPGGQVVRYRVEPPALLALFDYLRSGGEVEAHNAGFDGEFWEHVMVPRRGWPALAWSQWRCTSSAGAAWGYPLQLALAAELADVPAKMYEGKRLIQALCRPQKNGEFSGTRADFQQFFAYCVQDVRTTLHYRGRVPDLSETEQAVWEADQRSNSLGLPVDDLLAESALAKFESWRDQLNAELKQLTGVERGTMRDQVREWLRGRGVELPNTEGDVVDSFLARPGLPADCRRVLQIMRGVNRTSTKKYRAALEWSGGSRRVRRALVYGGTKTMRWAGRGMQPHNLPRGLLRKGQSMDEVCDDILTLTARELEQKYCESCRPQKAECGRPRREHPTPDGCGRYQPQFADLGSLLSTTVRGVIKAPAGRVLKVADYSAIEARVLSWLAGDEPALQVFRNKEDIYCYQATEIYQRKITKADEEERQLGKQSILGLGYGMGDVTFLLTVDGYNIKFTREQAVQIMGRQRFELALSRNKARLWPDAGAEKFAKLQAGKTRQRLAGARLSSSYALLGITLCRYLVAVYREKRKAVVQFWADLESAACSAVREGPSGAAFMAGRHVSFRVSPRDGALECLLPSGRAMRYLQPQMRVATTPWGDRREQLTYLAVRNKGVKREGTYGGTLAENVTQAVARDLLAEAMVRADRTPGLDPLMTVHDELVCEADEGFMMPAEYAALVSVVPGWADGCPIDAEAHDRVRYRK